MGQLEKYLRPAPTFVCGNESIKGKAQDLSTGQEKVADKAKSFSSFVRHEIEYNLYVLSDLPEYYRASRIPDAGQ